MKQRLCLLIILYDLCYLFTACCIISFFNPVELEKEKILEPSSMLKVNAQQLEWDVMLQYLLNQLKALELKQEIQNDKREQKEQDRIYDIQKKRMELEKRGVSWKKLDKYFCLYPPHEISNVCFAGEKTDSSSTSSNAN